MFELNTPYTKKTESPLGSTSTMNTEEQGGLTIYQWDPIWQNCATFSTNILRLCPYCGKYIPTHTNFYVCESEFGNQYACHEHCKEENQCFTEFPQIGMKSDFEEDIEFTVPGIGADQYLVTCRVQHPLTSFKYFQTTTQVLETQNKIICDLSKNQPYMFEPNKILLPLKEFKLSITLKNLRNQHQEITPFHFKIALNPNQVRGSNQKITIVAHNTDYKFIGNFNVIADTHQKNKIIDDLNYKYRHQFVEEDIVAFNWFALDFGENPMSCDDVREFNNENERRENDDFFFVGERELDEVSIVEDLECEIGEQKDLEFVAKMKTQNGSKQFQKNVKNYKPEEISQILQKVLPYTEEIILDEYGNYMFQSLLRSCNYPQRLTIIERIKDKIPQIVCKKQGTFVFQLFISLLTSPNEFESIAEFLIPEFNALVEDDNGNHFMRKFIQLMPKQMLIDFNHRSIQNLIEFGTHKNAVCVMKSLLRALKEAEKSQIYYEISNQLLSAIIHNTFQLINDQFGNYLIQEAYQKYGAERLFYLNEVIYLNVYHFCLQKYSSNVVIQCFKKYWVHYPEMYTCVEQCLQSEWIQELYRHRQSNKVLLQIVELPFHCSLKEKILCSIRDEAFCKFYPNRWSSALETKTPCPTRCQKNKRKYIK